MSAFEDNRFDRPIGRPKERQVVLHLGVGVERVFGPAPDKDVRPPEGVIVTKLGWDVSAQCG